jgi:hypothetical protein
MAEKPPGKAAAGKIACPTLKGRSPSGLLHTRVPGVFSLSGTLSQLSGIPHYLCESGHECGKTNQSASTIEAFCNTFTLTVSRVERSI